MEAGQDMGSPAPYTISIVIPVHNVAAYLNACVDSIASQAAKRTEIILVDDGSTDASPGICDDYALAFQNISVIHKENGGLSDARNAGVRAASGEWLLFVDGDDWIEENSLAEIERAAARACPEDLIFLQMSKVFPDGKKTDVGSMPDRGKLKGAPKAAALDHLASLPKFPGSACAKLIRRSVLTQNNIRFQEGLLSEDIDFMIRLILHCARFDCRAQPYYCYRQARAGSITYGTRAENVRSLLSIIEKWVRLAQTDYRQYERCIYAFLAYEYAVLIGVRGLTPKAKTKEEASENDCLWREIRKLKFLLGHARGARAKTIAFACRIMGLRLTALLASQYIRRRRACGRRR